MNCKTYSMAAYLTDNRIALLLCKFVDGISYISYGHIWLAAHLNTYIKSLLCILYKLLPCRINISQHEHSWWVSEISLVLCCTVDINYISILENNVITWNAVAYHIIYRYTHTLRISLISKTCRNSIYGLCIVIDKVIQLSGRHSYLDKWSYVVEHRCVDLWSLPDSLDLLCVLDHRMCRDLESSVLHILKLIVKSQVTGLVFLTTSAPAHIISTKFHN